MGDLRFEKRFGLEEKEDHKTNRRLAVRGMILNEGKILMVKSNLGDYKLPGGGVDDGERDEEALIREIQEETGFKNCQVKQYVGAVVESHWDVYEPEAVFEMTSHYYICEWPGEKGEQNLDSYEEDQEFTPVWIRTEEAIAHNEKVMDYTNSAGELRLESITEVHTIFLIKVNVKSSTSV